MFSELEQSEAYKKLSPKAQELYKKILFRCALTGENPNMLFDELKEELRQQQKER
jgi:hypothetical protein